MENIALLPESSLKHRQLIHKLTRVDILEKDLFKFTDIGAKEIISLCNVAHNYACLKSFSYIYIEMD